MNMNRKLLLTVAVFCTVVATYAQTYTLSNATNGNAQYVTTCSGTFVDDGGAAGNYTNGVDASYTFYPAVPGQYASLSFTAFNTQATNDYLAIYDGPGGPLIASYSGTPGAFTVTASASNPTRALTCRFHANNNTVNAGWSATVSCSAVAGAAPVFTPDPQDCQQGGGMTICSNSNLTANSGGAGAAADLSNPWDGCLAGGENQSSWYYFSPSTGGNIGFTIAPANGTDDYDFAIWGPFTDVECPLNTSTQPLRCSYSGLGGNTGCGNGAVDLSEGSGGDKWVSTFNVTAGEIYVMVIDNFVSSGNPFTLTWNLTGGANLDCAVLPIEMVSFTGDAQGDYNMLQWQTASELNNDYFVVERSLDGSPFDSIGTVDGAGTSTQILDYQFRDFTAGPGIAYYRIRQRDFDGRTSCSEIIYIARTANENSLSNIHPMPTDGAVNFDFNAAGTSEIRIVITDVTGRLVVDETRQTESGRNAINTSIADEPAGTYLLMVTDSYSGRVSAVRIVKY